MTPGRGGQDVHGVPVYNTVREAVEPPARTPPSSSFPPAFAAEAILEAAENGIELIVCITEGIPVQDMIETVQYVSSRGVRLIGPNCPGLITPGQGAGGHFARAASSRKGRVGLVSRSGTLTYEVVDGLTDSGHRPVHLRRHRR